VVTIPLKALSSLARLAPNARRKLFSGQPPTFQINSSSATPLPSFLQVFKMDDQSIQNGPRQVQVLFTTNFPDIELPEGKRQLLVPTGKYLCANLLSG
jgi:hypothetical protein